MTTAEVIRVLDADEACKRILAAGYAKKRCAECDGSGHRTLMSGERNTGEIMYHRALCGICYGAGFTWEPPAKNLP